MRRAALLIPLILVACIRDPKQAALNVTVTPTFKAGCLIVRSQDAVDPSKTVSSQHVPTGEVVDTPFSFAVFRNEEWSRELEIVVEAREASCSGAVVFAEQRAVTLPEKGVAQASFEATAADVDGDGFVDANVGERPGTDCQDRDAEIHPGLAEVCDGKDNDCRNGEDDGLTFSDYWLDGDGDGVGISAGALNACAAPPGFVPASAEEDCNDADSSRRPRDGGVEIACDGIDDDCDGAVDDDYGIGVGNCQDHATCAVGDVVCDGPDRTTCTGPDPFPWYPDADGDGDGAGDSIALQCTAPAPDASANDRDCDDLDGASADSKPEVCDGIDNDCDGTVDDGLTDCGRLIGIETDAAVTGPSHDWNAIGQQSNGRPVWLAGNASAAAYVNDTPTFYGHDGKCAGDWLAAGIHPDDNDLILAGAGGKVARIDSEDPFDCLNAANTGQNQPVNALFVFKATGGTPSRLRTWAYLGDAVGRLYLWELGTSSLSQTNNTAERIWDIHGLGPDVMLVVGDNEADPTKPRATTLSFSGGLVVGGSDGNSTMDHPLPAGSYSLRSVVVLSPTLGYAVGTNGAFLRWNGGTSWERLATPADMGAASFTAITAAGPNHVYATDDQGTLRRWTGMKWVYVANTGAAGGLKDVSARLMSDGRLDLWAVGHDGTVLHFHE